MTASARFRPAVIVSLAVLLAVLATASLTACGGSEPEATEPGAASGHDEDTGPVHVHGLGVNPLDGSLYAATHTGLFRVADDEPAERVGDRFPDVMGFTVIGPNRFLSSGHPDLRDYRDGTLPPLLGLRESDDGGRTWQSLSLLGEADLHVLRAVDGVVYAYDSTGSAFLVSSDRQTWEARSSQMTLLDFDVSPGDPEAIVATTPAGVLRSTDGGRTWSPIPGAPTLELLAWPDAALVGSTVDGTLYASTDGGANWQRRGQLPGPATALAAADTVLYASVDGQGFFRSDDGGAAWRRIDAPRSDS